MKIMEVSRQVQQLPPRLARKQARINQLVAAKIQGKEKQPPTKQEVIAAQFAYNDLERKINDAYVKKLERQLAAARAELA